MAPGDRVERLGIDLELVRALAAGRLDRVTEQRRGRADEDPIVEALVDAELAIRRGVSTVAGLVDLAAGIESEASDVPTLRWWAGALVAERCCLVLDVAGARRATAVLAEVPDDPLVPVLVLWVRGRLRRVAGLVGLFGPNPDRAGSRRLRSQAVADLTRGGFPEEVAVTRVLAAAGEAVWLLEDVERNLAVAVDARAMVGPDSVWSALLDAVLAVMAVGIGDRALVDRFLGGRERFEPPSALGVAGPVLSALRDLEDRAGSPSASEALAEAAVELRGTDPLGGHHLRLVAASALVDVGQSAIARELALPVLDMPPVDQVDRLERDVLMLRLRLHAGDDIPMADMTAALDRFAALGHPARIGGVAWRLADDLTRMGRELDAGALRARHPGPFASPRPGRPPASAVGVSVGVPVRAQVMAPVVVVEVRGQRCPLRTTAVRLLLALLLAHPAPLAAETAADALWPTAAWDSDRRRRLNTVVHRLRRGLGDAGTAVGRVGDVLTLTADGWDVDLFRLRRALGRAPGPEEGDPAMVEALAGVSGNLGHVQFPYDDQLVDERQMLVAAISRRLGTHAGSPPARPEHAEVLRALGASPPLSTR